MCDYDGDFADFDVRRWVRARKAHRCYARGCSIGIRVGDVYHQTTYGSRGERPTRIKHCARCWSICTALWSDGAEWIDYRLDCGESWKEARSGAEPGHLAFITADEAQRLLLPANLGLVEHHGKNG